MNTTDEGNILFAWITSNEPVCIEGWNKFSVSIWSPWESNLTHRRSGCQLGLFSINFDFRNVIFKPMVFPFVWAKYKWKFVRGRCKLPFLCPSWFRRSLARSRETCFTRPNRRACSQVSSRAQEPHAKGDASDREGRAKKAFNLGSKDQLTKKKDRVLIKDLIQGQPTSSFGKYLFGRRFEI